MDSDDKDFYNELIRQRTSELLTKVTSNGNQIDQIKIIVKDLRNELSSVQNELIKYKGMLGGAVFVISSLVTLFLLLKDWFFTKG